MQVLKFGGTSVANAENINKVISIVQEAVKRDAATVIVLSALGGTTDDLLNAAGLASKGDLSYKEQLQKIEQRHLSTVKELIPLDQQSSVLSMVKKRCNEIEDICNGVFLLKELSLRTKDSIISYGELISSQMFAAKLKSTGIRNTWKDSRELIVTNSEFGMANVDFVATTQNMQDFFSAEMQEFISFPALLRKIKMIIQQHWGGVVLIILQRFLAQR